MTEMKTIFYLSVRERHDKPLLVLFIFLSVIFLLSPLSGMLIPGKVMGTTERHYHDCPQGFFTFFMLVPDKNSREDTTQIIKTTNEGKELSIDTTPKNLPLQKNLNVVIW
jgi:hypothetical protein